MTQNNEILVVGSVAFDDVETPFGKAERVLGGSTLYFAAAAGLFAPVRVVSVVGRDMDLSDLRFLQERGVDMTGLQVEEGKTFAWGGRYDYDLNHTETLFTDLNVYADFHPVLPPGWEETPYVFLANIHPVLQREVLSQARNPRLTMMDTMNLWLNIERDAVVEVMRMVDLVSINESEVRLFAGTSTVVKGVRQILELGPRAVLVKKGEYGSVMITRDDYFVAPAFPIEEVYDPTGAGDSFAGGFMGYLARGGDLSQRAMRRAVIHGSAVGSFTIEQFSLDRLRTLTPYEVSRRVTEFRQLTHFEDEVLAGTER
ncbi:MAG: PfkB family carbohydrate kinase [Dehalococcoidia bacterium]